MILGEYKTLSLSLSVRQRRFKSSSASVSAGLCDMVRLVVGMVRAPLLRGEGSPLLRGEGSPLPRGEGNPLPKRGDALGVSMQEYGYQ